MALINDKEFTKWVRSTKHDDYTLFLIAERAKAWNAYRSATSLVQDRYYEYLYPQNPNKQDREPEYPWDA